MLNLTANALMVTRDFGGDQVTGSIQNSVIYKGQDPRLGRLDMQFDNVQWRFLVVPGATPTVHDLMPIPRFGEPCRMVFRKNSFTVDGELPANVSGH